MDEENFPFSVSRLVSVENEYRSRNTCSVEKVRRETNDDATDKT
jgi:hypothetical protein